MKSYQPDLRYRIAILREFTAGKTLEALPAVAETVKRDALKEGMEVANINRYLAILRRVANLAVKWGWTDIPIGQRIETLPGERQRDALLTPAQVELIASKAPEEVADAIRFAALTGLRRAEQMGLRADQLRAGVIWLDSNTKSGKPRVVPLPPEAARIAQERLPWAVGYQMAYRHFKAAARAVGLPNARWHDLRHAFGSWLMESGASPMDVRDLMGHSSLAVTSRYLHAAAERLRDATARLPRLQKPTIQMAV